MLSSRSDKLRLILNIFTKNFACDLEKQINSFGVLMMPELHTTRKHEFVADQMRNSSFFLTWEAPNGTKTIELVVHIC